MVFNVVPEDPQEPHVADDVQPTSMQKHGRQNCWQGRRQRVLAHSRECPFNANRHYPELKDESVERATTLSSNGKFEQEHQHVQADDEIVDERRAIAWLVVAD